jgi:cytochrome P450
LHAFNRAEEPPMSRLASINPLDPAVVESPFEYYRALREEAPVHRVPGLGFFIVTRYDLLLEVLADTQRFSSRSGPAVGGKGEPPAELIEIMKRGYPPVDTLLSADPPEHTRYRSLCTRAFSGRAVARIEPYIRGVARELADRLRGRSEMNVPTEFGVPLPLTVIADQLGVPRSDMALFKKWSDDSVAPLGGMISPQRALECAQSIVDLQHYFAKKIEERRTQAREDILSDLVDARLDGVEPLNVAEMLSILQQFLVAGNETTANLIASAVMLLIQNPDQLKLVREDRALIPNLIEEALRLESPVQTLFRMATCDTEVGGVEIPKGARIAVSYAAANRDPAVFPDPDRFDVTRKNAKEHLAFSRGEHFCIGAALARKEANIAFETLLERTDAWRFSPGKNDFKHVPSFILRGLEKLWVQYEAA